jgi:hypothetical protein
MSKWPTTPHSSGGQSLTCHMIPLCRQLHAQHRDRWAKKLPAANVLLRANVLPTCCQRAADVLHSCCERAANELLACC